MLTGFAQTRCFVIEQATETSCETHLFWPVPCNALMLSVIFFFKIGKLQAPFAGITEFSGHLSHLTGVGILSPCLSTCQIREQVFAVGDGNKGVGRWGKQIPRSHDRAW